MSNLKICVQNKIENNCEGEKWRNVDVISVRYFKIKDWDPLLKLIEC